MSLETAIRFGNFSGFTWIRCEGKGSFLLSATLKECADRARADGEKNFVVDLEACTGMDSTFMGFLAGLASKVMKVEGKVSVTGAGERNRRSLEDLGLDCLLSINPEGEIWDGREEEIRGKLAAYSPGMAPDMRERARHVLESHQTLAGTSKENADRFAQVIKVLEDDASSKKPSSD